MREAKDTCEIQDEEALDFVQRLALSDAATTEDQALALKFAVRFQQTTGPLMAKAVEDTAFYCYSRLLALNEVGGEPGVFGAPLAEFHRAMIERYEQQPSGLSATATHDTKRGDDARARLYALSEMPEAWASGGSPMAGAEPRSQGRRAGPHHAGYGGRVGVLSGACRRLAARPRSR